jgi:hypothetical protein
MVHLPAARHPRTSAGGGTGEASACDGHYLIDRLGRGRRFVGDADGPPITGRRAGHGHVTAQTDEDSTVDRVRDPSRSSVGRQGLGAGSEVEPYPPGDADGPSAGIQLYMPVTGNRPEVPGRRRGTLQDSSQIGVVPECTQGVADSGIDRAAGAGGNPACQLEGLEQHLRDLYGTAGLGMEHGQLGVCAEPAAGQVDLFEGSGKEALGDSGLVRILHSDRGRGPDRPERPDRESGVERGRGGHREVPPDVTVGLDEVAEGADVDVVVEVVGEPESTDDEVEPFVVEVVLSPVERETPPFEVVVVAEDAGMLDPGCSRATTTAITAVAPVAASTAPRVRTRRRV